MPDTRHEELPILRELRDDLAAAYAARDARTHELGRTRDVRTHELGRTRERRRAGARRRIAALAAAAAAGFGAVLVALPGDDRSAANVLEAAAAIAAVQPEPVTPGTFAYFSERSAISSTVDLTLSGGSRWEWWVAHDGSGRALQRMRIDNDFERPSDDPGQPRWRRVGRHQWARDVRFGPGEFDRLHRQLTSTVLKPQIDRLPTEPAALETSLTRQLRAAARDDDPESGFQGPVQEYQLFTVVEQLLAHPLARPELRSALYRVAATFEDTTVQEGVEDPAGRPATALVYTRRIGPGTERTEIFFDPHTAASLGTRITRPSMTTETRVYTPPANVDSVTARP